MGVGGGGGGGVVFICSTYAWPYVWQVRGALGGIELLLSTVNGVAVPAPEESYPVAAEVWQKCREASPTISETGWREIGTPGLSPRRHGGGAKHKTLEPSDHYGSIL